MLTSINSWPTRSKNMIKYKLLPLVLQTRVKDNNQEVKTETVYRLDQKTLMKELLKVD